MKKFIPLFFCLIIFGNLHAQVVFCPPGATWHYVYNSNSMDPTPDFVNVAAWNNGTAVIDGETVTVLKHDKIFRQYNTQNISETYLKQIGDTIFMKSIATNNQWRILFNFAATAGQSWKIPLSSSNITFTVTVDSVNTSTINGFSLKTLYTSYQQSNPARGYDATITERIGGSYFLFNFLSGAVSDGDYMTDFLCYQDSTFGLAQFSNKPCYYSNLTGISETSQNLLVNVYPNPATDYLNIELETDRPLKILVSNILGQAFSELYFQSSDTKLQVNVSTLPKGIYTLQIFDQEKLIGSKKIIRN